MKAVISNRIYLNRTKELHDYLVEQLTYSLPPVLPNGPPIVECEVTRVNKNILTIPVGRTDLIPEDYEVVDKRTFAPTIFPEFKFTLREDQQTVYDAVDESCIIIANPSWGKTFTAIAIATKLKQRTLIVVHTSVLFDQWRQEIEKTLGIKPGIIGGGKESRTDSAIVIGMKQTLERKANRFKDAFGLIMIDEAHHIPATVFKGVVDKFKARYKIGLTATPWRKDGKHVYLKDYLNTIQHKPLDRNRLDPNIIIVDSGLKLNCGSNTIWANKLTELYENPSYIELVTNISQIQVNKGFKVLTVADRVQFLKDCSNILPDFELIIGETRKRNIDLDIKNGILGTQKIFAEGYNEPRLGSLVMGTPINNRALLEQLLGRISRKYEGKDTPEVIDISFRGNTGLNQMTQRINFYLDHGLNIKQV